MYGTSLTRGKLPALLQAAAAIAIIALVDWRVVGQIPLGFLYLLPMLIVGGALGVVPIATTAVICTFLAELFDDLPWSLRAGVSRDVLYFAAFLGAGLFVREINRNRAAALAHLREIELQSDARREAEEQLRVLIESSPVAIITGDARGCVLMANEAAHRMLGLAQGELSGKLIPRYFPALTNVSKHDDSQRIFRAVMQARGRREDGDTFLADICFSTYETSTGSRLTAIVIDTSEELRTQEVSGFQQLLAGSRIAVGAISHEVRNVCGAIAVVHQNLARGGLLTGNKDFEALGNLVVSLERIISVDLRQTRNEAVEVDLTALLEEFRIVVAPSLEEEDVAVRWNIQSGLPLVWADRSSLMQVFLNLATNSIRALSGKVRPAFSVTAESSDNDVILKFIDNGGGVADPERLFRPFQAGAEATGLGLYLSRAFMRSFGGDLRYQPLPGQACFIVTVAKAAPAE